MDQFSQIRSEYNVAPLLGDPLPLEWPGPVALKQVTDMAVPLFIIAATICRFIRDQDFDPQDQINTVLDSRNTGSLSHIGQTYLPILERVFSGSTTVSMQMQKLNEFRSIMGAVITVAEPLSCLSLGHLLNLPPKTIKLRLRELSSVLQIPQLIEAPIRLFHLSFGEYLSSEEIKEKAFYIDRATAHAELLRRCLTLMSRPSPGGLDENMCQLSYAGELRKNVSRSIIDGRLPAALQYACQYWVFHVQQSDIQIFDGDEVDQFLRNHFLHWLEALSLLNCLSNALEYIAILKTLSTVSNP